MALGVNMAREQHTLAQLLPRRHTQVMLALLLCNVGLQIFSHVGLSAVIRSNQCGGSSGSNASGSGESRFGVCVAAANYSDFEDYWVGGGGAAAYTTVQGLCGQPLGIAAATGGNVAVAFATYDACARGAGVVGPVGCVGCYADVVLCTTEQCASPCFAGPTSAACAKCVLTSCNPGFEGCSGQTFERRRRTLAGALALASEQEQGQKQEHGRRALASVDSEELCDVFEISFGSSVEEAINGEAYGIAIVIIVFSGIWPYAKNVIMLVAWVMPMTAATRSTLLRNLTRLAKWSLVDVFAIVIIVAGVRVDKGVEGAELVIVAESRIAIYTFCIAAIWDLIQGEVELGMHRRLLEQSEKEQSEKEKELAGTGAGTGAEGASAREVLGAAGLVRAVTFRSDTATPSRASRAGKLALGGLMLATVALLCAGAFLLCVRFTISGLAAVLPGPNDTELSAASITSTMVSTDALHLTETVVGTVFLMLVYVVFVLVIPLCEYSAIAGLTFHGDPASRDFRAAASAVNRVGGFACLDVFVLSFVVVLSEWDQFINAALEAQAEGLCPGEDVSVCITMTADILDGIYLLAAAAILGWVVELFFSYCFAQLYIPFEGARAASCLFDAVMKPSGYLAEPDAAVHKIPEQQVQQQREQHSLEETNAQQTQAQQQNDQGEAQASLTVV